MREAARNHQYALGSETGGTMKDMSLPISVAKLLACPFCGSLDLWYYPDATAVGCRGCFMTGPIIGGSDRAIDIADQCGDEDAAVMLWNTRQ